MVQSVCRGVLREAYSVRSGWGCCTPDPCQTPASAQRHQRSMQQPLPSYPTIESLDRGQLTSNCLLTSQLPPTQHLCAPSPRLPSCTRCCRLLVPGKSWLQRRDFLSSPPSGLRPLDWRFAHLSVSQKRRNSMSTRAFHQPGILRRDPASYPFAQE